MILNNMLNHNTLLTLCLIIGLSSCGGAGECFLRNLLIDPSGRWVGRLDRTESDCPESRATLLTVEHEVSLDCVLTNQTEVRLTNEDNLDFEEVSFNATGGGSFEVANESSRQRINITYKNFDGELADVEEKIRLYRDGKIVCSEVYKGQLKKE